MKAIARILILMLTATLSWAQVTTGTFLGTVTDTTGAAVSGVSVRVTNVATNQFQPSTTNESGDYRIVQLPAGVYQIEFKRAGFNPVMRAVELRIGDPIRINQTLLVANTATTQQVESNPGSSLLQTDSAAIGGVVSAFELLNLPNNGRQYETFVQRFPGAVLPVPGSHIALRGGFNFAGIDEHYNSSMLDGIDNIDPVIRTFSFRPSLDAIEEIQVIERGYNAEFGRNAGGVINIITKSGTNKFHGSFWEFLRNDNLDARNFFSAPGSAKAPLIRHQAGLTLGGPLRRDKTFFFAEFEVLRQKAGTVRRATVPTLRMRSGDLSEYLVPITDPRTGQIFSNGMIPQSSIDPIAFEVLQAYPLPNLPNAAVLSANRIETANRIENGGDFSFRVDQVITGSTRLMARSSTSITRVLDPYRTDSGGPPVNLSGFGQTADRLRTNAGVTLATTRGSGFTNELRAGYNRFNMPQIPLNNGTPLQIPNMGFEKTFLDYAISPFDTLGSGSQFKRAVNVYNYIDNASQSMGNHQLKVGVDVRRYLFNAAVIGPNTFIFTGSRSGNALADFLFGLPTQTISLTGSPGGNTRKTEVALFAQGDWRIHPRLTLNYGLRWEYYGRITEETNKQSMWVADCNCIRIAGVDIRKGLVPNDLNNFAPRLGFAFRPFGQGAVRTVIRGAAGIYYDSDMRHNSEVNGNPPFVLTQRYTFNAFPSMTLSNPFPASTSNPALSPVTLDSAYRDTYLEDWSLGVQHEFGGENPVLVDISYVGNHSLKARRAINLNQPINGVRPYAGFSGITDFEQAGSSSYNAMQVRVERRFQGGLGFMSSYTWGHAIDDRPGQGASRVEDNYNLKAERGDSDFDVRHHWTLSGVYELPFGPGRKWIANSKRIAGAFLSGWNLSGIATIQGGRPFSVILTQDISGSLNLADRPNLVPGVSWKPEDQGPNHWINPAAFSIPASGTFGNLGRNTLRGPQYHNIDLSLSKEARIGSTKRLQVRAEVFNVANHPNFGLPSASLSPSLSPASLASFGVIPATAGAERQIQLGVRIGF